MLFWMSLLGAITVRGGDVSFAGKPSALRSGDTTAIRFAVSTYTDVEVAILDAKGEVVRHLAAGMLGKNPPAPLQADSLKQSLVWDGKDDDGLAPTNAPFRVRVGLGLKVAYAGKAFAEKGQTGPNHLEGVLGMCVAPDGRLYVLDRCNGHAWGGTKISVFRRDGAYERTIKPFPSDTPVAKGKAAGAFLNSFGGFNPIKQRFTSLSFYPADDIAHQPVITPDNLLLLAVAGNRLAALDRDGGLPDNAYSAPVLGANVRFAPYPVLAAAADGKAYYLCGLLQKEKSVTAIYRVPAAERAPAETWFGEAGASGKDDKHLGDARSVAADGKGHVLIADFGNNRVLAVNESDRSLAGTIETPAPEWVGVHRKSGAVYVQSGRTLIKFSGWSSPKELARVELEKPAYNEFGAWRLALDAEAEPAVVWAAVSTKLVRYEDQGAKFADPVPADCFGARVFYRPAADPYRREVLCKSADAMYTDHIRVLDEATGAVRVIPGGSGKYGIAGIEGQQHRLGPDGSIYYQHHWDNIGIARYDRNGKPKPFAATANDPHLKGRLPVGFSGTTNWERDFSVDRHGNIYVKARGAEYHGLMSVRVYGPEGEFLRTILQEVSDGAYGPRLDPLGNLYIMEAIKPLGQPFPDEFKEVVAGNATASASADWIYGSVVKFGPAGGAVWFSGDQAPPLTYEGWGLQHVRPGGSGTWKSILNLRTTGGALTGALALKPPRLRLPDFSIDTSVYTNITFRLKNDSAGTQATIGYTTGLPPGGVGGTKTISIQPNSDYTEYTFAMSGDKDWKGFARTFYFIPTMADKGTFSLDWFRFEGGGSNITWNFNAEESQETKLPSTMKKEKVGAYFRPGGAELQGALWWRPGFSPLGDMVSWMGGGCHCTAADFDVDSFGRTFAPDAGRYRIGVLDSNGNEILSFGGYGNQDCCGPESYVVDPSTKVLRPRREGDPATLASPYAQPEIAFAWVAGVAVTDRHAYTLDVINKRILRLDLKHAAEEVCDVK
jgi:hypothetical protein